MCIADTLQINGVQTSPQKSENHLKIVTRGKSFTEYPPIWGGTMLNEASWETKSLGFVQSSLFNNGQQCIDTINECLKRPGIPQ